MSFNLRIYLFFISIFKCKEKLTTDFNCQIVLLSSLDVGFAIGGDSGIDYLVLQVHYASVDKFQSEDIIQLNCCIFIIIIILFVKSLIMYSTVKCFIKEVSFELYMYQGSKTLEFHISSFGQAAQFFCLLGATSCSS